MSVERAAPSARLLGRAALAVFLVLLVSGFVLLFSPEIANDLDERSAGGGRTMLEALGEIGREGVVVEVFAVPALAVLLRCVAIALLAWLAAVPLLWGARRMRGRSRAALGEDAGSSGAPAPAPGAEAVVTRPSPPPPPPAPNGHDRLGSHATNGRSAGGDAASGRSRAVGLPVKAAVTRLEAERAKIRIMEGIPLLREVFAARGRPTIANTLPDMRVRVKLTDTITKEQPLPVSVLVEDPVLALATFRTEIEQRLRRLARDAVDQSAESTDSILRSLADEGLFEADAAEAIRNLLKMTEEAVLGARVEPSMGAWVREEGVSLLLSLDLMLPS